MSGNEANSLESTQCPFNALSLQGNHVNEGGDGYNSDATIEEENYHATDSTETKKRLNHMDDSYLLTDTRTKRVRVNTQWPDDVQEAFEEAISLIPKKTLKNIKINGTTQGRNQYISMYIRYKTGIHRTSKQVSSHIQGLCSSKREYPMKKFLIEGPDENDSVIAKFSQLFSKIMREQQVTSDIKEGVVEKYEQRTLGNQFTSSVLFSQDNCIDFKKIDMCYVNFNVLKDSHVFSKANDSTYGQVKQESIELSHFLKNYPNFHHILNIFDTTLTSIKPEFPLITIDVPFLLPFLESDLLSGNYNFSARFTVTGMPKNISYNIVTVVMKGGKIVETNINQLSYSASKSKTDHTFNVDIASKYWKKFFSGKHQYGSIGGISDIEFDVNYTSIFQYILDSSFPIDQNFHIGLLNCSMIKCLLVWDFKVSTDIIGEKLRITKVKEFLNSKSPQKSLTIGTSIDGTFKLSTPLSIIAEQRRNGVKPLTFVKPCVSTDSPLSAKHLKFLSNESQGLQSLLTPPHTAFPCILNELEPHKQAGITDNFISQDIFNNITQQKILENDIATDKEKFCDDEILDQSLEDYKNIFSSPNLQMYDFL